MYYDRFDICEAWYLALSHCHAGAFSPSYKRLCKMQRYFKPGQYDWRKLNNNARAIYHYACNRLLNRNKYW